MQFDLTLEQQRQQGAEKALQQHAESLLNEKKLTEWRQQFEAAKEETGAIKQQLATLREK